MATKHKTTPRPPASCAYHDGYNDNCISCRVREATTYRRASPVVIRGAVGSLYGVGVYEGESFIPAREGYTIGLPPTVNMAKNICLWHDGTIRPMRGHKGNCKWKFDGYIWEHL